jgi:hypothetical protein
MPDEVQIRIVGSILKGKDLGSMKLKDLKKLYQAEQAPKKAAELDAAIKRDIDNA